MVWVTVDVNSLSEDCIIFFALLTINALLLNWPKTDLLLNVKITCYKKWFYEKAIFNSDVPNQMFHILVHASLTEKQLFLCCVWLSKSSIDLVWLPQASIDKFFRPQKCETFGRVVTVFFMGHWLLGFLHSTQYFLYSFSWDDENAFFSFSRSWITTGFCWAS